MAFDIENIPTASALASQLVIVLTTPPAASTGIPTLTEVNAGLAAQCFTYGRFNVTPSQNTGEGPRKSCRRTSPTELGLITYPAIDVQYSYLPQELGTPGHLGNKLYEALEPGTIVTVVTVDGLDAETTTALAAGDVGDVYLVEVGARRKGSTGDGEFDKLSTTQSLVIQGGGPVAEDHAFAA